MTPRLIFMLTRDDRTVADAESCVDEVLSTGVRDIGFKDIGLASDAMQRLVRRIRDGGATVYLEVVSLDEASEVGSARAAVDLGVDVLMGGTHPASVLPILAGSGIRYYPFAGTVTGHPSQLQGTIETIVANARDLTAMEGVDGVDLLAYRFEGNVVSLVNSVCQAVGGERVIVAGSLDRAERFDTVVRAGALALTVGTAAFAGVFPAAPDLSAQVEYILGLVDLAKGSGSEIAKVNLQAAFSSFSDHWSPKIVGDINDAQVKLAKFEGQFHWHHHDAEDELFLVIAGRLRMGFRDRQVDLQAGEFIIVPKGVEHRPEALDGECHILLLEPRTTLNTGNVENERTVRELDRIA